MSEVVDISLDGKEIEKAVTGREVLVRTFTVADQSLDGRTLHVRVVPFDEVATVADPPDFRPYKEQFLPGVFDRNERAANRIRLRSDHEAIDERTGKRKAGLAGVVGRGVLLRETKDGYEAEFRFLDTPEGETARALTADDGFDGVSAEFVPIRSKWLGDVKQRVKAHLDSVALAIGPAYTKAEILALREGEIIEDPEMIPPAPNRELLERCAKLGVDLPKGMATLLSPDDDSSQSE